MFSWCHRIHQQSSCLCIQHQTALLISNELNSSYQHSVAPVTSIYFQLLLIRMPNINNCSVILCPVTRNSHPNISIFGLPTRKSDAEWAKNLLAVVTKRRERNDAFNDEIAKNKVGICELHFDSIYIFNNGNNLFLF